MSQGPEGTRRTINARTRGRAEKVVQRVVSATAEELNRVGYAAMSIEDVAARSGVHKTTIYRRWTTKAELVAATITALMAESAPRGAIDTGTVRGDLRASMVGVLGLKPSQQGILRIMQVERGIPEVNALARRFSQALHSMRLAMVQRGISRGELPQGVDATLIVDLVSALVQRALLFDEKLEARYLDRAVDVVLAGAAACAPEPGTRASGKSAGKAPKARPRAK
jgi:AcrR family transcriptional regulator